MNGNTESIISCYLSFKLGKETFAANTYNVIRILEMGKITEVPRAPEYMMGVINLRGTVLPVVDLRLKLGMQPAKNTKDTCIIVLEIELENRPVLMGVTVDSVEAVMEWEASELLPPPALSNKYRNEFIKGITYVNEGFIIVLDMDAIFSTDELAILIDTNVELQ